MRFDSVTVNNIIINNSYNTCTGAGVRFAGWVTLQYAGTDTHSTCTTRNAAYPMTVDVSETTHARTHTHTNTHTHTHTHTHSMVYR